MSGSHLIRMCLVVVLGLTAACSGGDDTAAEEASSRSGAPSAAASAPPSAAPEDAASATSTEMPNQDIAGNAPHCEAAGDGAQQCTTTVFEPELSFTLPAGWMPESTFADSPISTAYVKDAEGAVTPYLGFTRVTRVFEYAGGGAPPEPAPAPDDLVGFLADLPGTTASDPESVTVDGRDATQVDITTDEAPTEAPTEECGGPPPDGVFIFYFERCLGFFLPPGEAVRFVVVEMDAGPPMVVSMEAPPSDRDQVFGELDEILQSLTIGTAT